MAAKAARRAMKPRSVKKRAARRVTRKAARKARRAAKPKAPKAATKPRAPKASKRAVRRTKVKKPQRVTKKMQTGSFRKVWNGTAVYTKGGLTKKDLMLNKNGKVVSKKQFAAGQKLLKNRGGWTAAVMKARKELGITGFCIVNRGAQGVALYKRAKELHKN